MTDFKNNLGDFPQNNNRFWDMSLQKTFILGTYTNTVLENWVYQHENELVDAFCSGACVSADLFEWISYL